MSLTHSLRRTAVGVAATAMLVGGALGFVSVAGTAGAEINAAADVATTLPANGIALNNATASSGTPCPTDGFAYWHFILAPNNNTLSFTSITLNLGTETRTFSGAQLVPNGTQTDNVFVGVPAGFTLTSIVLDGSYAIYGGSGSATNFTLSHVCAGTIPTTSTTSSSTTSSSTTSSSTTSSSTTRDRGADDVHDGHLRGPLEHRGPDDGCDRPGPRDRADRAGRRRCRGHD